jgi:apolipoprotein N-acyltransferase
VYKSSRPNLRQNGLALLSAALLFAAAPGQWSIPFIAWFALVPLIIACHNTSWRTAAKLAFLCGLVYNLSLIYWIVIALNNYGGLPIWLAALALILLAAYLAFYMAGFAALLTQLRYWPLAFSAPLIWVGLDLIKAHLFTGFPWQDLGYFQYQNPLLIQFADLVGHHGLTFVIVMTNAMLASLILPRQNGTEKKRYRQIIFPIMTLTVVIIYSFWSYQHWQKIATNAPTINVTLVQGNIDQGEKWRPGQAENTIDTYQRLSRDAVQPRSSVNGKTDLIIWPETALPFFPLHNPLFTKVLQNIQTNGPTLITGAPHYEEATATHKRQIHNSAFAITATNKGLRMQRYDKEHLVPFGEYVPFADLFGGLPLVQSMGNFSPGTSQKLLEVQQRSPANSGKANCGMLICFESIFPSIARKWSSMGANLLVNITNDAWYGHSSAPWQQLSMVTLRAVENRRSLVRAANTGISVFIDPLGRLRKSPLFAEYSFKQRMPLVQQKSFFSRYGYLFAPLCLLIVLLMSLRRYKERHILAN